MSRTKRITPVLYFHPDDPAGWLKPDEPFMVDGLDWSWAFVWYKDIPGFPAYRIGSNGLLWSCLKSLYLKGRKGVQYEQGTEWHLRRPIFNRCKYLRIPIYNNRIERNFRIHQLVMEIFVGPRPPGIHVLHRDDDRTNNRLSNLYYGTPADNHADAVRNGRKGPGNKNGRAKVTEADVIEIRETYAAGGITQLNLAIRYKISENAVCDIVTGDHWPHVGGPITKKGSRNFKLTPEAVDQIREWVAGGMTSAESAKRVGVDESTVRRRLRLYGQ